MDNEQLQNVHVQVSGEAQVYGPVVGVNTGTITTIVEVAQTVTSLHQLPAPIDDFVGRVRELAQVHEALRPRADQVAIAAICGMGGLGKTELALRAAHELRPDYPDTQLFLSLRASAGRAPRSVADALRDAIHAFDPRAALPDDLDALAARYRALLSGKRALVLLDDAPDDASVRSFLPPAGCALLVTSRMRLSLGNQGTVIDLSVFSRDEARALLLDDVPRLANEPVLEELLEHCADLPLAVRVAGSTLANNPALSPQRYLARLEDEQRRPNALRYEDTDVYAILGVGDDALAATHPELARRWRMLSVCPAPFEAATAAAIWNEHDEDALANALGQLLRRSLIKHNATTNQYYIHDLLRDIAAARRAPEDDVAARLRHAAHYLARAREAQRQYEQRHANIAIGLKVFDASWSHIRAAAAWLIGSETPETDRLLVAYAVSSYELVFLRTLPEEQQAWFKAALAAARRLHDRRGEGWTLINLGQSAMNGGDMQQALPLFQQAAQIMHGMEEYHGEAQALLGMGNVLRHAGHLEEALAKYQEALALASEHKLTYDQSNAFLSIGNIYNQLNDAKRAIFYYGKALPLLRKLGDQLSIAIVLNNLGGVFDELLNQLARAIAFYRSSLAVIRTIGDKNMEARIAWGLAEALLRQNNRDEAIRLLTFAVAHLRASGQPEADECAALLEKAQQGEAL